MFVIVRQLFGQNLGLRGHHVEGLPEMASQKYPSPKMKSSSSQCRKLFLVCEKIILTKFGVLWEESSLNLPILNETFETADQ